MNIFITGSSGYIGGMLVERFSEDPRVTSIVALDMVAPLSSKSDFGSAKKSDFFPGGKISFITHHLGDPGWEEKVLAGM